MNIKHKQNQRGFTLMEVIVVMAILGILTIIATPNIVDWSARYRLRAAARDIYSALVRTKSEAIKQHTDVAMSFGTVINGTAQAYIIYVDSGVISRTYEVGEQIIQMTPALPNSVVFDPAEGGGDGLTFVDNGIGNPTVVFRQNGRPDIAGTASLVSSKNGDTRDITVTFPGAIRID